MARQRVQKSLPCKKRRYKGTIVRICIRQDINNNTKNTFSQNSTQLAAYTNLSGLGFVSLIKKESDALIYIFTARLSIVKLIHVSQLSMLLSFLILFQRLKHKIVKIQELNFPTNQGICLLIGSENQCGRQNNSPQDVLILILRTSQYVIQ